MYKDVKNMEGKGSKRLGGKIFIFVLLIVIASGVFFRNEIIYGISGRAKIQRKFQEDINGDGKKEEILFTNTYATPYTGTDEKADYVYNFINIYIDDNQVYSSRMSTYSPLRKPKLKDVSEENIVEKQLCLEEVGRERVPQEYFFVLQEGEITKYGRRPLE